MNRNIYGYLWLLLALYFSTGYADFENDRCYEKTEFTTINRLYLGKKKTSECRGRTIEQCSEKLGVPDKPVEISEGVQLIKFYGEKKLYIGTGVDNESIGPEWKEMRVENGKIVGGFAYLQILEHGYSWSEIPKDIYTKYSHTCEPYGECNAIRCSLTPVEPIPVLPEPPDVTKEFSDEEIFTFYLQRVSLDSCADLTDDYKEKVEILLMNWRQKYPGLVDMIEASPEFKTYKNRKATKKSPDSTEEAERANKNCGVILENVTDQVQQPDPRFSSPNKTWSMFLYSLKSGDREAALFCLSGNAKKNFLKLFPSNDRARLKEFGDSFGSLKLMDKYASFHEAYISRKNGNGGVVVFVEFAGNWKIGDM